MNVDTSILIEYFLAFSSVQSYKTVPNFEAIGRGKAVNIVASVK